MRLLIALLLGLLATPVFAQLHPTGRAVVTDAIEKVIRPGFAGFATQAADMKGRLEALCAEPSEVALSAVREQFGSVVTAWSRIEWFRFGPLMADNRSDRILFWPDRKGIALKQVQAILADADVTATDPETLASKSVAVQGLTALEYVLYGTGAEALATPDGHFRCDYAHAIAALVSDTAAEMSAEWNDPDGISARMVRPSESDTDYRSNDEVLEELVGVMAHGVEAIRDQRILPFLGRDGAAPKPKSALFWRSNQTVPSILANFDGLRALLVESDIWERAPNEQMSIGKDAIAAFGQAAEAGKGAVGTVEQVLADPAGIGALTELVAASQTIGKLTGEDLPAALGLSVGFSSLDGD